MTVHLQGGDLLVEVDEDFHARLTGPAEEICTVELSQGVRAVKFAKRLDAVPPYLFAELERKVSEAEKAGVDVISLGIGDPDLPTPPAVIDALAEAARDPRTHQYPTNHGTEEFRTAGRASTATASASSSIRTAS